MGTFAESIKGVPRHEGTAANTTPTIRADHNALADWVLDNVDGFVSLASDLAGETPFWPGKRRRVVADPTVPKNGDYVWETGTGWRQLLSMITFTYSTAFVDDTVLYPAWTLDSTNSTDTTIASFQQVAGTTPTGVAGLKIARPGIYAFQHHAQLALPITSGRGFVQIGQDSDLQHSRASMGIGEDQSSAISPAYRISAANQVVPLELWKHNGNLGANSGRVIVTRLD